MRSLSIIIIQYLGNTYLSLDYGLIVWNGDNIYDICLFEHLCCWTGKF